ncbi:hypothetical protein E3N88_29390 [Mikania micrantha]|uniref:Integrase catalytic domain-containing protein n=1 Tax=Mikania micrantha TaxID=192012 RepID=A0A5N6MKS7_9ASTR|nr:hypothetical protein E3N88_29390 [Mikania micrantha]
MHDTAWLWHARLGHINFETLRNMAKVGMADGLPIIDHKSKLCEACLGGKHHSIAESEFGCKVKALRTDRGVEFTSRFEQLCSEDGIQRYLTAPYTPQQNGAVERKNQIVLGATRSMMKAMDFP